MRLCLVLLGMVLALAACSSHPVTRATTEAPIVPLVEEEEEEASVASSNQPSEAQTAPPKKAAATKRD